MRPTKDWLLDWNERMRDNFIVEFQDRLIKLEQDLAEAKRVLAEAQKPPTQSVEPLQWYPEENTVYKGIVQVAHVNYASRRYGPLFAAAPDLLEAAESALMHFSGPTPTGMKLRAAIRRAKGAPAEG